MPIKYGTLSQRPGLPREEAETEAEYQLRNREYLSHGEAMHELYLGSHVVSPEGVILELDYRRILLDDGTIGMVQAIKAKDLETNEVIDNPAQVGRAMSDTDDRWWRLH